MKSHKGTIYCSYTGYITQAIVNIFAPLLFVTFNEEFGISFSQITLITTLNFTTQLIVDLLSSKFVDKIGYRVSIVSAHIFSALGLLGMAFLPGILPSAYSGLLISVILYAIGGGLIEVLISPIVEACPSDDKASAMSLLHSFYCWGSVGVILLSTGFFAAFGREHWRNFSLPLGINTDCKCILLYTRSDSLTDQRRRGNEDKRALQNQAVLGVCSADALRRSKRAFNAANGLRLSPENGLKVSKTIGDLAGPCFFSVLMGLARVFYAKFSEKIDILYHS